MSKPRHRAGLASLDATQPTLGAMPSTALYDPTPLIGRESLLEAIRDLLLGDAVRLVTLVGPGGIGKTRLALAAARYVEPAFPDGVWFVDLALVDAAAGIDTAIGRTLGLAEAGTFSPSQQVAAYVKNRRLLMILDNFEHLASSASRVAELLASAPRLKVLVTSREPLKLRLEHRMKVSGLDLPDAGTADVGAILQAPAVALFLEHARRIQPKWVPTPLDARAVAALVRRLEGIPLAIRIAAAQSHMLSPAAMLERLQGHALLSTEEWQDAPVRHLTLRRAIEWSYGLLATAEQAAFRQLGVFVGNWTLEAAETVIQNREPARATWAILATLVDKSLIESEAVASEDRHYRLLEPIREFALELLRGSEELEAAQDRHAQYYVALAERASAVGYGPGEEAWFRRLDAEYENLRAAFRWAVQQRKGELSLRFTAALLDFDFWFFRGNLREVQRWLQEARSLDSPVSPVLQVKALYGEGSVTVLLGDYPRARALLQDALALAESIREPVLVARATLLLGALRTLQDETRDAQAVFESALALSPKDGYPADIAADALIYLGQMSVLERDLERADVMFAKCLGLARSIDSARIEVRALINVALLKLKRRNITEAADAASKFIALARAMESRRAFTWAVLIAALANGGRGDFDRAARLLGAVDASSEWGDVVSPIFRVVAASTDLHARARKELGEAAYHAAVAAGRSMSVGQITGLARESLENATASGAHGTAGDPGAARPLLTAREQAVLRLISEGLPTKQIATALSISERTVKTHIASVMNKLGVDNRAHAAVTAIQRGLL